MKIALVLLSICLVASAAPQQRIIGGTAAEEGQFPYIVSITLDKLQHCAGFIYNDRWILTAASCVKDSVTGETITADRLQVIVGEVSVITTDTYEDVFEVNLVRPHPEYDPLTHLNDLALIEVTRLIDLNGNIDVILYDDVDASPTPSEKATIMGWGATLDGGLASTRLRYAEVTMAGDCTVYGATYVRNYMICAGVKDDMAGPCTGDEGAPLVQDGYAVGIVSLQRDCGADPFYSSLYTRLSSYFQWIQGIAGLQPKPVSRAAPEGGKGH